MSPSSLDVDQPRFDRLGRTSVFRNDRLGLWLETTLGIIGQGLVGFRVSTEAVLSGAKVQAYDPGVGQPENQGTQLAPVGVRKVVSAVAACAAICPGRAVGFPYDIRHAGVGQLARLSMLVDCSDDPALAVPLTRLSNGLGIPLLRLAVDGSGELEMGRVQCSHGGAGYACQMCTYDFQDLFRPTRRTPCPGQPDSERAPTLAGGPLAAAIGGSGLVQAQRLATGNDLDRVVNREIVLDMSHWKLLTIQRRRSKTCLSGHVRWQLTPIGRPAAELTLAELFAEAQQRLGARHVALEPYGHALCVEAVCPCGARREATGTRWATPPDCKQCRGTMRWLNQTQLSVLEKAKVEDMEIDTIPLSELGMPSFGAMFVARTPGKPPLRMLLD